MTNFNYSLDKSDYTLENALFWGNFIGHCKKSTQGTLGDRIVHVLIAAVEFFPIISQIASLFEKIIIDTFSCSRPVEKVEKAKNEPISIEMHEFKQKKYKRNELTSFEVEKGNLPVALSALPKQVKYFAEKATYYGYNAEGIRDYGWGCAWRSIQTCLSPYQIDVSFETLFHLFGREENLKHLYQNKYPTKELTSKKKFAPYDIMSGWAEPFIGHMVMHYYKIDSVLECLNNIPAQCLAPVEVFHNKPFDFSIFRERLENHFKNKDCAPVMLDEGTYALTIVGIERQDQNTILWIGDPHIKEGVNRELNTEKSPNGLYKITLDHRGKQIRCSLDSEDRHQLPKLFCAGSYRGLHFDKKSWMILFPQSSLS